MADLAVDWKNPDYGPVWAERIRRLKVLRELPDEEKAAQLAKLKAYYKDHPADFINDWGCTFDPRNAERGLPTTMPFLLFPKQREYIEWLHARWKGREDGLVEKSRDMGISWLCVGFSVWMWVFHPGSVSGFGSRKEDLVDRIGDPDSLFWKARTMISLLPGEFKPKGYDEAKYAPFMRIINPETGGIIRGEAGANIGRGGRTSIYFKDESAFYEQAQGIDAALSQTTNCQIDVSTPNGEGNPFWKKRHGGKIKVFVFDWRDDPRKDQAWYDKQVATRDAVTIAQEIDRNYSASVTNSWITSEIVTAAMERGPADVLAMGPIRVGLDVARFGDDKTVLTFRRGRLVLKQVVWGKTDLMSTAGRAKQEINTYRRLQGTRLEQIAVDTIGIGAGVADALRGWPEFKDLVVDVNSAQLLDDDENYNLRALMWREMRDWIAAGASLPNDQELRVDLTGLRYFYRIGKLLMESKDDAKKRGLKSPDRADSLALTFAKPGPAVVKPPDPPASRVASYDIDNEMGL